MSKVYTINYWLKNEVGEVVDTSEGGEPMTFSQGDKTVIPGIQKAVEGRSVGDVLEVTIPPEMAYGAHDPSKVNQVPVSVFDGVDAVKPGMKFQTNTGEQTQVIKVTEVDKDMATVDANHPLAGFILYFDIEIVNVEDRPD